MGFTELQKEKEKLFIKDLIKEFNLYKNEVFFRAATISQNKELEEKGDYPEVVIKKMLEFIRKWEENGK